MKKTLLSQNVRIDKTELAKTIVYKLEDDDDVSIPPMHFTLNALRAYVVDYVWDKWEDVMGENETQEFTKMEIIENDEFLFSYLDAWNYKVTRTIVNTL
jgi:hypothetical protein